MNPNPSIIVVSLVTRAIVSRTTFADWAIDNGERLGLGLCGELANAIRDKGVAEINDHLLIAVTADDSMVLQFLRGKVEANREVFPSASAVASLIATVSANGQHDTFLVCPGHNVCDPQSANTADEAIAKVRANILSPKDLAEKKRAQAETLLREADELHPAEKTAA